MLDFALFTCTVDHIGAILVNLYRNPAITAKMASTLDSISNGRLELGLSAGWYQKESKAYGIEFPTSGSTRVQMLEESIIIIKRMLQDNDDKISFKGKYYNILNAECNPKPIHKPHLPIWIGISISCLPNISDMVTVDELLIKLEKSGTSILSPYTYLSQLLISLSTNCSTNLDISLWSFGLE